MANEEANANPQNIYNTMMKKYGIDKQDLRIYEQQQNCFYGYLNEKNHTSWQKV